MKIHQFSLLFFFSLRLLMLIRGRSGMLQRKMSSTRDGLHFLRMSTLSIMTFLLNGLLSPPSHLGLKDLLLRMVQQEKSSMTIVTTATTSIAGVNFTSLPSMASQSNLVEEWSRLSAITGVLEMVT